jgi:chromosome segregation ATPase
LSNEESPKAQPDALSAGNQNPANPTDVTPKTAYEQIMQTLADTDTVSVTAVADLEVKLDKTKEELRKEKQRASRAENSVRSYRYGKETTRLRSANEEKARLQKSFDEYKTKADKLQKDAEERKSRYRYNQTDLEWEKEKVRKVEKKKFRVMEQELKDCRKDLKNAQQKVIAAEDQVKRYRDQVQDHKNEAIVATQKASEVEQQIVGIWAEMQKSRDGETRKRKVTDNGPVQRNKAVPEELRLKLQKKDVQNDGLVLPRKKMKLVT